MSNIETNRLHKENQVTFRTFHNVDNALHNLLISAVHPSYIHRSYDNILGCRALLALLWTKENQERVRAPPTPIEDLFTQLEVGQRFATDGIDPLTDNNIIRMGYNIIKNTGLFSVACRESAA
jgi:hypothetical protein